MRKRTQSAASKEYRAGLEDAAREKMRAEIEAAGLHPLRPGEALPPPPPASMDPHHLPGAFLPPRRKPPDTPAPKSRPGGGPGADLRVIPPRSRPEGGIETNHGAPAGGGVPQPILPGHPLGLPYLRGGGVFRPVPKPPRATRPNLESPDRGRPGGPTVGAALDALEAISPPFVRRDPSDSLHDPGPRLRFPTSPTAGAGRPAYPFGDPFGLFSGTPFGLHTRRERMPPWTQEQEDHQARYERGRREEAEHRARQGRADFGLGVDAGRVKPGVGWGLDIPQRLVVDPPEKRLPDPEAAERKRLGILDPPTARSKPFEVGGARRPGDGPRLLSPHHRDLTLDELRIVQADELRTRAMEDDDLERGIGVDRPEYRETAPVPPPPPKLPDVPALRRPWGVRDGGELDGPSDRSRAAGGRPGGLVPSPTAPTPQAAVDPVLRDGVDAVHRDVRMVRTLLERQRLESRSSVPGAIAPPYLGVLLPRAQTRM